MTHLTDPVGFPQSLTSPLLVWENARPDSPAGPVPTTSSGHAVSRPQGGETLVFDEIDAGIGGAAASAVGERLASLARTHQVIVVTHLAQVAAFADCHLVVTKTVSAEGAHTDVVRVEGEERVGEIARMLSGDTSAAALVHARDLLGQTATQPSPTAP